MNYPDVLVPITIFFPVIALGVSLVRAQPSSTESIP
jgi:hypothetical protein